MNKWDSLEWHLEQLRRMEASVYGFGLSAQEAEKTFQHACKVFLEYAEKVRLAKYNKETHIKIDIPAEWWRP